jgi:hypothetical protein
VEGQYKKPCDRPPHRLDAWDIFGLAYLSFLVLLLVSLCVWCCWDSHQSHKQAKIRAAKDAEEKPRRDAEKAREEERKRAAEVDAAVELSTAVGRRRIEVSARLARDAVQSAMASPIYTELVAQLSQQGKVRQMAARYTQLVEEAVSSALVGCELNKDRRLLSLMALNPDVLPPPSLHVFCRSAIIAAATDVLGPFLQATVATDAAAVVANGVGVEDVEDTELVLLPSSASSASTAESDQLAAATEAAASVIQLECKQFVSAWLTSTEAALRQPLKQPPSLSDLQRDAAGPWKAALALPAEPTAVDMPANAGNTAAAAAAGAGIAADEEANSNSKLNLNSGQSLHACASPSAPAAPSDSAAAVPLASELRLSTAGTSAVARC